MRSFALSNDYMHILNNKDLVNYLSIVRGSVWDLPDNIISIEDKRAGTRVSTFNNKLRYIDSKVKGEFIKSLYTSTITSVSSQASVSESLSFVNDLIHFSNAKGYQEILKHGSPPHELVLPNLA